MVWVKGCWFGSIVIQSNLAVLAIIGLYENEKVGGDRKHYCPHFTERKEDMGNSENLLTPGSWSSSILSLRQKSQLWGGWQVLHYHVPATHHCSQLGKQGGTRSLSFARQWKKPKKAELILQCNNRAGFSSKISTPFLVSEHCCGCPSCKYDQLSYTC